MNCRMYVTNIILPIVFMATITHFTTYYKNTGKKSYQEVVLNVAVSKQRKAKKDEWKILLANNNELSDFKEYCNSRLSFLLETSKSKNYDNASTNIPANSEIDQIGHFVLKCFSASEPDVKDFLVAEETNLFIYRQTTVSRSEKEKLYENTLEQIEQLQNYQVFDPINQCKRTPHWGVLFCTTLKSICKALLIPKIGDHLQLECAVNCNKYHQNVHFQMCLSFVRDRSVIIQNGFALVPCSKWDLLLVELFVHHYDFGVFMINNAALHRINSDDRWTSLFNQLKKSYDSFVQKSVFTLQTQLTARQIDTEKRYFPPCMAHLLVVLQTHHRLSHNWRYRFSLFLKDIGLSVDESIEFWKNEYSKSCTAESNCQHSWQTNHRKYMYNIRHLYGAVGFGKKNAIKGCAFYEELKLGMREEGGCPFVHFDDANLINSLSSDITVNSKVMNEIFQLRRLKKPVKACHVYRMACAQKYRLQIPAENFNSPVEYYQSMKLCIDTALDW